MVYNLEKRGADIIKIMDTVADISAINYGPYDNGHVLIGLSDGLLLAFSYP